MLHNYINYLSHDLTLSNVIWFHSFSQSIYLFKALLHYIVLLILLILSTISCVYIYIYIMVWWVYLWVRNLGKEQLGCYQATVPQQEKKTLEKQNPLTDPEDASPQGAKFKSLNLAH